MKIFNVVLAAALAVPAFGSPVPGNGLYSGISTKVSTKTKHPHHHTKLTKHTKHTKCSKTATATPISGVLTPSIEPTVTAIPTTAPTTTDEPVPTNNGSSIAVSFSGVPTGFSTSLIPVATSSALTFDSTSVATETSATPSATTSTSPKPSTSAAGGNSPDGMLRGVNVGNWLILEKFMDDDTVFTGKYSGASDQWSYDEIDTDGTDIQKHVSFPNFQSVGVG